MKSDVHELDMYEFIERKYPKNGSGKNTRNKPKRIKNERRRDYLTSLGIYSGQDFMKVLMEGAAIRESRLENAGAENRQLLLNGGDFAAMGMALRGGVLQAGKDSLRFFGDAGSLATNTALNAGRATTSALTNASKQTQKAATAAATNAVNVGKATNAALMQAGKATTKNITNASKATADTMVNATRVTADTMLNATKATTSQVTKAGQFTTAAVVSASKATSNSFVTAGKLLNDHLLQSFKGNARKGPINTTSSAKAQAA